MTTGPAFGPTSTGRHAAPGSDAPADPGTTVPRVDPAAAVPAPAGPGTPIAGADVATASIGDPAAAAPAAPGPDRPDPADSSTGELLRTLTENIRSLVQGEVASARREMTDKALAARPAAAMLGGAAVLGALATGTSAVVLIRFLDRFLPPTTSAVAATALLGGGAAALAKAGVEELRLVGPLVPERTIESVKADVAAVREAAPS
jgi:Putative Actinobacterial Holin-X, holin superfamily III